MWLKVMKLLLDMLRRVNVEKDKDPIDDMLRKVNAEIGKDPIYKVFRMKNFVEKSGICLYKSNKGGKDQEAIQSSTTPGK